MPYWHEVPFAKNFVHFIICIYKMENIRMTELRNLTKERDLRGYFKLRKAELIAFLQDNERRQPVPSMGLLGAPQPQPQPVPRAPQQTQPLTKRQRKRRGAKDSKLAKCFIDLNTEINTLKLQMEALKEKISLPPRSAHSGFKRKKI